MSEQRAMVPQAFRAGEAIEEVRAEPRGMVVHETASAAAAAKAQALVQARYLVAMRNPRDWLDVRSKMLAACKRTRFAQIARYSVPRAGGKVKGWTIRFAEEAIRNMRNLAPETAVIVEDDEKRIVNVSLADIEANLNYSMDIVVTKTIERKSLKEGELPIRQRLNSQGQTLYILPASDDDLITKQAALVSKALRTMALRLIPGDILDECLDEIEETQKKQDEQDPKAAVKKIADAFSDIGVKPSDLKAYLRHEIDTCSPKELAHLRELFSAIKEGSTNWTEVMADAGAADGGAQGQQQSLKQKVAEKAAGAAKKPAPGAPTPPADGEPEPPEESERIDPTAPAAAAKK